MKTFFFAPVLLLLAVTTSWVSAVRDENGLDLDKIAVRLILDGKGNRNDNGKNNSDNRNDKGNAYGNSKNENGKPASDDAFCTDEEHEILAEAFINVLPETAKRQLRAERNTLTSSSEYACRRLCAGWPYRQCIVVYPWCRGFPQRDLVSTMDGEVEPQPRLLENNVSIAASNKCGSMKKSIENEIDAILSQDFDLVSKQCTNLLDMGYKIACVYVEDEDYFN